MVRWLVALALSATLASACDENEHKGLQDGGNVVDALARADTAPASDAAGGTDAAPRTDAAPGDAAAADAAGGADAGGLACVAPQTPGDGHHNAGADCMGCHNNLSAALKWTVAGTLYTDVAGTAPVGGATIRVRGTGGDVQIVTATNGNFFTTQPVTFPTAITSVDASKCPALAQMQAAVTTGSCNSCHGAGFRIHLP